MLRHSLDCSLSKAHMKATLGDFLLCGAVNLLLIAVALVSVYFAAHAITRPLLGDYHVVADFYLALLMFGALAMLATRVMLLLRPLELGEFNMANANFTYWKLLVITFDLGRFALVPFTLFFLRPLIAKGFGATIGNNVAIGGTIEDPHLVTIGDGCVIGNQSLISGNMTSNQKILIGKITIGSGVTVGANSVVMPNTTIGDNVVLGVGSVVVPGTTIPPGESWRGNPARKWQ